MTTTCSDDNISFVVDIKKKTDTYPLLENVHLALPPPNQKGETFYTRGRFTYFHYGCDGTNDNGWGCGYRTLQSAASWLINKRSPTEPSIFVPSIDEIQKILVNIGDKSKRFVGSREWIGTLEVFYVLDLLFTVPCKILHVQINETVVQQIRDYFVEYGGLIMMGGMTDSASKGIAGIHLCADGVQLLIVDPHYAGVPTTVQELIDTGFIRWTNITEFNNQLYNLCMPLSKQQ